MIKPLNVRAGWPELVECASACEREILDDEGVFSLKSLGGMSRQRVCQFLGIAESTLSMWLKERSIPRYAAVALVLYRTVSQLERDLSAAREPFVAEMDGLYAVIVPDARCEPDKERIGYIAARHIRSRSDARRLVVGMSSILPDLLQSASDNLQTLYEQDESLLSHVGEVITGLERMKAHLSEYTTIPLQGEADA